MALASYADIVTAVGSYLARADLTANIPDFIVGAETRIAYGYSDAGQPLHSPPLRVRAMETTATISPVAGAVALPTSFLSLKSIYEAAAVTRQLEQVSPEIFYGQHMGSSYSRRFYIIEGENILVGNGVTSDVRITYYKKFDALATASPVPWLLTASPLTYVYGALLEAMPFIMEDQRLETWAALFAASIKGLNASDKRDRWGGSALAIRNDTGNP